MKKSVLEYSPQSVILRTHEMLIQRTIKIAIPLKSTILSQTESLMWEFSMRPITVGNMHRISIILKSIPSELLNQALLDAALVYLADYHREVAYVIATAIQNDENEPDDSLINRIIAEFDAEDLFICFDLAMKQLGIVDFINSIILAKGAEIMKISDLGMSPIRSEEIIAEQNRTPGE